MSFGKMNFDMRVHASVLASGYPESVAEGVKDLLLAAPWKRLESDGFYSGQWTKLFPCHLGGILGG